MGFSLFRFLLGAIWAASGALMAFNPPPQDFRRAAALPAIGFITMGAGIYFFAKAFHDDKVADSGKPPRHARKTSGGQALTLALAYVVTAVTGAFTLWWGIHSGLLSMVGLGAAALGPWVLVTLNWLVRALRRN